MLLTPSCTDALEMSALLAELRPGDEVVVPSFTFVSTANAFALLGVRPVFADVDPLALNIDPASVESLIGPKTRALVVVHYGGVPCDLARLTRLADEHGLFLIEDNAHGLLGKDCDAPLGSRGRLATLSFHETKNFSSGEGGALVINDPALVERAEVIWEKGTNRSQFFRGQVAKYTWVDLGSSYLMADPLAAVLTAQFAASSEIQARRAGAWNTYRDELGDWARERDVRLGTGSADGEHPYHLFWMWMPSLQVRTAFISHMRQRGIQAVFHYQALNASLMGQVLGGRVGECPVSEAASDHVVRLPLFSDIAPTEVRAVVEAVLGFDDAAAGT